MNRQLTVIIEREGDGYVSFCPDIDVASQGATVQEASANCFGYEAHGVMRRPRREAQ